MVKWLRGFPCCSAGKESACTGGDLGLIPGLGRSPGEGKVYPLQYSGLENSMWCIVHGVTKSLTQLSNFHFYFPVVKTLSFQLKLELQTQSPIAHMEIRCNLIAWFAQHRDMVLLSFFNSVLTGMGGNGSRGWRFLFPITRVLIPWVWKQTWRFC